MKKVCRNYEMVPKKSHQPRRKANTCASNLQGSRGKCLHAELQNSGSCSVCSQLLIIIIIIIFIYYHYYLYYCYLLLLIIIIITLYCCCNIIIFYDLLFTIIIKKYAHLPGRLSKSDIFRVYKATAPFKLKQSRISSSIIRYTRYENF
jgi:hypothetical protein